MSAPDDHTFVVELTYNCPYFLDICAFPNTMPLREDIVEGNTTWTDPSTYVTNGPFKMESGLTTPRSSWFPTRTTMTRAASASRA